MGGPVQVNIQYVLELLKFHVDKTRSADKDTDIVAFRANVGNLLYPTQTKRMENIQDADYNVYLYVGPILAPANTPVTFTFTILNSGYDASNSNAMLQILNNLSDLSGAVCAGAFSGGNLWDALNKDTKYLNGFILANCNGPVAADGIYVAIIDLQHWTANGRYERTTGPYIGTLPPKNPVLCRTDSNYTVTWRVVPKTDALGILGMSSDGRVWNATHEADFSWIPFAQLTPPAGSALVDASHAGSVDDLWHICATTADGGLWHTMSMGEQWLDVRRVTANPGGFGRVGMATVFGELHICSITPYDGNIWHVSRHTDGSWQPSFINVKSQTSNPGHFIDVDCAGAAGDLHLCGITTDGNLWHTIRHIDGTWQSSFEDVKSKTSNPGAFIDVSCAGVADELHLCGVTSDGGLWHTIRHMDGTWSPFFDVKNQAGNPSSPSEIPPAFVDCSIAGVNGDLQLCGVTSDGSLWLTIRHAGDWWELFENVTSQSGSQGSLLSVSATELFTTWAPPQPPQVSISGPFNVSESLTDLLADPVVGEGPYFVDTMGLQAPLTIQWTGGPGTTIAAPTAPSTTIDCDMTGQVRRGGGKVFGMSVQVTDRLGVSGSARAGISIHVFDDSKGGG